MDNSLHNSKPAASPKKLILKITIAVSALILMALGSFFLFQKSSKTPPTLAHFFSPEFDQYAIGADASDFVIIRNDDNLKNFISTFKLPIQNQFNDFKEALILLKRAHKKQSSKAILHFGSTQMADEIKNFLASQPNYRFRSFDISSTDGFLTISDNTAGDFKGSFYDNPHLTELDQNIFDSQLTSYKNSKEVTRTDFSWQKLSFGILPLAEAAIFNSNYVPDSVTSPTSSYPPMMIIAGASHLLKYDIFYLKINDTTLNLEFRAKLTEKNEFMTNELMEFENPVHFNNEGDKEYLYTTTIDVLTQNIPEIKNSLNDWLLTKKIPPAKLDLSFDNNIFKLTLDLSLADLRKYILDSFATNQANAMNTAKNIILQIL